MNWQDSAFFQDVTSQPDPCITQKGSMLRFVVLTLLFLTVPGGGIVLALLEDRPFAIQFSSMAMYTAAVALYTFSRNRNGNQPFLLSCPAVRSQLPRLIRRHLGFVVVLFVVQTAALKFRPNLPARLIAPHGTDASLFAIGLGVFCLCLGIVQILTNRSLLERAHLSA